MVIQRGDIWWTDLRDPLGSGPGYRRPVLIIQSDKFNQSQLSTVVVLVISTNLNLIKSPGNVLLTAKESELPKDSVVNVTQVFTIDESFLRDYVSTISDRKMEQIDEGLRLILNL